MEFPVVVAGTADLDIETLKGDPGDKGDKGDPGEKGDPGDPGEKGNPGEPGTAQTPAAVQQIIREYLVTEAGAPLTVNSAGHLVIPSGTQTPTPIPTPTPPTPTPLPPDGGVLRFNGDHSNGKFDQWWAVENTVMTKYGPGYPPKGGGAAWDTHQAANNSYSARIVSDPVKGFAARYEVRSGDSAVSNERSEMNAHPNTDNFTGGQGTLWYRWATKFDPTFPQNHASLGWGLTNQFHGVTGSSPPVGWYVDQVNGQWSLTIHKQSATALLSEFPIFNVPLGTAWHDVMMQINWSEIDTAGWIKLWYNGAPATFLNGTQQYFGRTMVPGSPPRVYYKEGYYRKAGLPTGIVYHTGFRCATTQAALG